MYILINGKYYTGKTYVKNKKKCPILTDDKKYAKSYTLGRANNARFNMKANYEGVESRQVVEE